MKKTESKGIVLIAAGHPYYGNYAYQLAVSIKANSNNIPISLIVEGNGITHLTNDKLKIFDLIIPAKPENYISKSLGIRDVFKLKTHIYDLSPYDTTLYLDADMLWLPQKNVESLFDELKDINFTMSNRGSLSIDDAEKGFIEWADPQLIKQIYGFDKQMFFHLSSEFIYFKKTKENKSFFEKVKKNFDYPKVPYKLFGNNQPDELSFTIAMMQSELYPHTSSFFPAYWEAFNKQNLPVKQMYENYFLCSFGGAVNENYVINFYNNLAQYYLNLIGETLFPLVDKRNFMSDRTII